MPKPSPLTPMPANHFNIAVNTFVVEQPAAGEMAPPPAVERDAESFAQEIADLLRANQAQLAQLAPLPIALRGPQEVSADLANEDALAAWMKQFNINLLISGDLRKTNERYWSVTPKFYSTEHALQMLASEALELSTLGQPILFVPGNLASHQATIAELRQRIDVLLHLISGLSYYDLASKEGMEQARLLFCTAASDSPGELDRHGRNLLFLFCGHSLIDLAYLERADVTRYTQLLEQGVEAYRQGLVIDPSNLRLQISLGAALMQQGSPDDGCGGGKLPELQEARQLLENVQAKPAALDELREATLLNMSNVLGRIHFGIGCLDPAARAIHWAAALENFEQTLVRYASFKQNALDFSTDAAYAHRYIGIMRIDTYFFNGQGLTDLPVEKMLDDAADHLDLAIRLLIGVQTPESLDYTIEMLKVWLTAACYSPQAEPEKISQYVDWFVAELAAFEIDREGILSSLHPLQKEVCGL
jgi:hypothetical protein